MEWLRASKRVIHVYVLRFVVYFYLEIYKLVCLLLVLKSEPVGIKAFQTYFGICEFTMKLHNQIIT